MKMRYCFLGLAIVGATLSLNILPAQAESKLSQCKRFDRAMIKFADSFITTVRQSQDDDWVTKSDRLLAVLKVELKQLENQKFTDSKIQAFHRQAMNLNIAGHNDLTNMVNTYEKGDREAFETYRVRLKQATPRNRELYRQFVKYCRQS